MIPLEDVIVLIGLGASAAAYAMLLAHFSWPFVLDVWVKIQPFLYRGKA